MAGELEWFGAGVGRAGLTRKRRAGLSRAGKGKRRRIQKWGCFFREPPRKKGSGSDEPACGLHFPYLFRARAWLPRKTVLSRSPGNSHREQLQLGVLQLPGFSC